MSLYRNTVFFFRGMSEFTKNGFVKASRNFNQSDLDEDISRPSPSLVPRPRGRRETYPGHVGGERCLSPPTWPGYEVRLYSYMITGANSGIGKATALALAKKGATVHMVCRNPTRGEDAKQEIISKSNNEKVHLHILDISKPRDVAKFADTFVESDQALDVLVNNAGCMVLQRQETEDGLEKNFATNTLAKASGPALTAKATRQNGKPGFEVTPKGLFTIYPTGTFILTTSLIPALERSSSARVVTVSSGGMLVMRLDPNDLQFENVRNFDGTFAYAQNKRQQVVMTRRWAEKFPNVHFSSMHPGWADTPDRTPASEHLPLAWTHNTDDDESLLMTRLRELRKQFLRGEQRTEPQDDY